MIHLGTVPASSTQYIPFATYGGTNGESITCTGLAVTDIEIYKNGSVTQRASDVGYTLLDTDGIDFDGLTGIHGFSLDLSDNTDAGFFSVGDFYWVVVSSITVDAQVVNFIAATFRIGPAESVTGYQAVDAAALGGTVQSATDLKDFADAGYDPVASKVQGVVLTDTCTTNTDMVTEPPTATAIVDEWETQSQADPTGFHVNVKEINATAQTANDNGADINTILSRVTAAVATAAAMATAQNDLDKLTGADGATLATVQANYAPNKVVPDAAGTAPTTAEIKTAMEADGGDLSSLMEALVNKKIYTEADGQLEMFNDSNVSQGIIASQVSTDGTFTTAKRAFI